MLVAHEPWRASLSALLPVYSLLTSTPEQFELYYENEYSIGSKHRHPATEAMHKCHATWTQQTTSMKL